MEQMENSIEQDIIKILKDKVSQAINKISSLKEEIQLQNLEIQELREQNISLSSKLESVDTNKSQLKANLEEIISMLDDSSKEEEEPPLF
ncbi:MAG: hypothetical protein R3Y52_03115 [Psittacicella sp.]